jgi:hypothetical protein
MRFAVLLASLGLLSTGCVAHAHTRHAPPPAAQVTLSWTWVAGHHVHGRWIVGHWSHPRHGKSYRHQHMGPPPARPHAQSHWVPGHYQRRGHQRHWVPGHWK